MTRRLCDCVWCVIIVYNLKHVAIKKCHPGQCFIQGFPCARQSQWCTIETGKKPLYRLATCATLHEFRPLFQDYDSFGSCSCRT